MNEAMHLLIWLFWDHLEDDRKTYRFDTSLIQHKKHCITDIYVLKGYDINVLRTKASHDKKYVVDATELEKYYVTY